jgi:hypothetical protein
MLRIGFSRDGADGDPVSVCHTAGNRQIGQQRRPHAFGL